MSDKTSSRPLSGVLSMDKGFHRLEEVSHDQAKARVEFKIPRKPVPVTRSKSTKSSHRLSSTSLGRSGSTRIDRGGSLHRQSSVNYQHNDLYIKFPSRPVSLVRTASRPVSQVITGDKGFQRLEDEKAIATPASDYSTFRDSIIHGSTAEQERDEDRYLRGWRLGLVIASLCLGTFLVALDIHIIGVAIPKITSVFHSLGDASWYSIAYLLPFTALQPTMGFMYKNFSVRAIYYSNILVLEAGSVLCAAAPNSPSFILGRALTGAGAAGLLQGALAIITLVVELERRPLFMGIVTSAFGVSACIGPVMGGALVEKVSWRWCFWINLPVGAVATVLLLFFLRLRNVQDKKNDLTVREKLLKMDYIGTVTFMGAMACMTLALQWGGQTLPWSSARVVGLLVGTGVLAVMFAASQIWYGDDALIPPRILRQRSILVGVLFLFFIGMFNYIYTFYLPFYFQSAQAVSPITSGVRIIPFRLPAILFIGLTGALVTKWGHYVPFMILGSVVCALGAGLVTRLDLGTPTADWAIWLVLAGAGMGIAQQMPYTAVQVVLSEEDTVIGNALLMFFMQVGGILSLPIAQSIFLSALRAKVTKLLPTIDPAAVVSVGAAGLSSIAGSSATDLVLLRRAYAESLARPFAMALAAACVAAALAPCMQWRNIKAEAARKKKQTEKKEKTSLSLSSEDDEREEVYESV